MDLKQQAPASASPSLLTVSPSPHARRGMTTTSVMKDVLIALVPTTAWGIYIYGVRAALVVLLSVVSAVLFEFLTQLILHRPITIKDCSAAVTGLLLGLNFSPSVPLYIPVVGAAFAIIVVKQLFGGLGKNIMNPALAARVFLMLAWTNGMSGFPAAYDRGFDAVASATPLVSLKAGVLPEGIGVLELFLGQTGGCIGELSALMILIGGIYLICRRVIRWHIPVAMLGTVALLTFLFPLGDAATLAERATFMAASLCSGGLMLGAVFMATDYVTSPVTDLGRLIYGAGCGALVVFIRYFGGYNEGVSFAILIMNALVWYLDMATKPRVFGKIRKNSKTA
ncbi:MAG: RnfABCDGE type electron transport complex subunit D [Clostridia bacterium]|nr:RnfABCDGE type electron transport complex subunit D [Clostridia bacterium]